MDFDNEGPDDAIDSSYFASSLVEVAIFSTQSLIS